MLENYREVRVTKADAGHFHVHIRFVAGQRLFTTEERRIPRVEIAEVLTRAAEEQERVASAAR